MHNLISLNYFILLKHSIMKTLFKTTFFSMMIILTSFDLQAQVNLGTGSGTSGSNRTFVGSYAGRVNTGANNSFFGRNTGYENTSGASNTFIGSVAGRFNTTGSANGFIGAYAGYANTTGIRNTFTGYASGRFNTTGKYNSFTGYAAGYKNTIGDNNTFTGYGAGYKNTSGSNNTLIGFQSGYDVLTSLNNTMLGYRAGFNAVGSGNVFLGYQAGYNESGNNKLYIHNSGTASPLIEGDFAANSLTFNGTLGVNGDIPIGAAIPTDIKLYINGRLSQREAGTLGGFASGDRWSSLGKSPVSSIYGMFNQAYGASFISGSKSGANNIIGFSGGRLDFDVIGAGGPTQTRVSILNNGNVGIGKTNPQYELDVSGDVRATGSYIGSDRRYKKNIKVIDSALDKINAIDGVTYGFKQKTINEIDFTKSKQGNHLGFIAQDLEEVFPELVRKDDAGYYSVNYDGLIPVLVEAIKEQEGTIDEQAEEILEQKEQITDLQSRIEKLEALLNATDTPQSNTSRINSDINTAGVMLRQNAPNPFNGSTTIQYALPEKLGVASLIVYDLNGRAIATYSITGKGAIEFDANGLPNGTYGYSIIVNGKNIASQKMIIQR